MPRAWDHGETLVAPNLHGGCNVNFVVIAAAVQR